MVGLMVVVLLVVGRGAALRIRLCWWAGGVGEWTRAYCMLVYVFGSFFLFNAHLGLHEYRSANIYIFLVNGTVQYKLCVCLSDCLFCEYTNISKKRKYKRNISIEILTPKAVGLYLLFTYIRVYRVFGYQSKRCMLFALYRLVGCGYILCLDLTLFAGIHNY